MIEEESECVKFYSRRNEFFFEKCQTLLESYREWTSPCNTIGIVLKKVWDYLQYLNPLKNLFLNQCGITYFSLPIFPH